MEKIKNKLLYILPGLLLTLAWLHEYTFFSIFLGFIPILFKLYTKPKAIHFWIYTYINMLIWNIGSTWWVSLASVSGGIAAMLANSLLMTVPLMLTYYTVKWSTKPYAVFSLIVYWLTFEYLHLRWELTWPWLTLGNAFAGVPAWVQWYEWTGHLGGSIWALIVNILLFKFLYKQQAFKFTKKLILPIAVVIIPLLVSLSLYILNIEIQKLKYHTLLVQPNIDPYNEKFGTLTAEEQLEKMLELASKKMTPRTRLIVFPETALTDNIEDIQIEENDNIKRLRHFVDSFPQISVLIGGNVFHVYQPGEKKQPTARGRGDGVYYDIYNTALHIEKGKKIQLYYKSKLVPGVEKMPYPQVFKFLEELAIDEGGISGSLGIQDEREVFDIQGLFKIAPVICYESVFGEYVTEYVKKGANVIGIITNDGWWGNTLGYRQHFNYARLRAIETRLPILRSANTGISGYINKYGQATNQTQWWVPDVVDIEFSPNQSQTLYTQFGDVLAFVCCWLALGVFGLAVINRIRS